MQNFVGFGMPLGKEVVTDRTGVEVAGTVQGVEEIDVGRDWPTATWT